MPTSWATPLGQRYLAAGGAVCKRRGSASASTQEQGRVGRVCPQRRPSLAKVLRHPWLQAEQGDPELDSGVESGDGDSWADTSSQQDNADTLGKLKLSGSSLESL